MINVGVLSGLGILLYSVIIFIQSLSLKYHTNLGPGPGFFPLWVNGLLIILSLLYIIESFKKDVILLKDVLPENRVFKKIGTLVGGLLFFCLTAEFLGFFVAGVIVLFFMFIWDFKWYRSLILSIVFMIVLVVVFQMFLKVSLPVNILGF